MPSQHFLLWNGINIPYLQVLVFSKIAVQGGAEDPGRGLFVEVEDGMGIEIQLKLDTQGGDHPAPGCSEGGMVKGWAV